MSFVQICMKSDAVVVILLQVGYQTKMSENHLTPQGQQEKGISDGVRFLHRSFGYALKNLPGSYTFFLLLGYEIIFASLLMIFKWDSEKNELLKKEHNICFEDVVTLINEDKVLDIIKHPNKEKYPKQHIYIVRIYGYVHMVPFIKNGDEIWLKTIIPSRKMNKLYKGADDENG